MQDGIVKHHARAEICEICSFFLVELQYRARLFCFVLPQQNTPRLRGSDGLCPVYLPPFSVSKRMSC